ncbi:TonB family protein [Brevundimonas sp. GCM10030266]|uniref:TonB family protein n=1 Tax=Brevundimonas sp. GCM10030266 TaxID=3273386 RepID=UPI00361C3CFC
MTEAVEYHRSRYDAPRKKGFMGVPPMVLIASLAVVSLLFTLLAIYFVNMQFKLREIRYTDESVEVELIEPIEEPPPPPPPPPPPTNEPPPPKLQVRVPAVIPTNVPVPPVETPPTPKELRIDNPGPPVITPTPPQPAPVPAPPRPSVITNPAWARQAPGEFPERAMARGIESGTVRLSCAVQSNGNLTDCRVVSETPSGAGFGQAALAAARRSRVTPGTVDGAAVGARVEWTQRYQQAD